MFAGLSLKTNTPSQKPAENDTANTPAPTSSFSFMSTPEPEPEPAASTTAPASSFSFMSSSTESEAHTASAPSSGRSSPSSSIGGFSFMNNVVEDTPKETPPPPTQSTGFSFVTNNSPPPKETPPPPTQSTGFSFVNDNQPSSIPLTAPATAPKVKKKRASKVRVGYARDTTEDDQAPPPSTATTSLASQPISQPTMTNSPPSSLNMGGGSTSISELEGDDLPTSVMAEITAAEKLEQRLKAEQEEKEIAEAIEAVAQAEAQAKAQKEKEEADIAAATAAALQQQQLQQQAMSEPASPVTSLAGKAKSWFLGGAEVEPQTQEMTETKLDDQKQPSPTPAVPPVIQTSTTSQIPTPITLISSPSSSSSPSSKQTTSTLSTSTIDSSKVEIQVSSQSEPTTVIAPVPTPAVSVVSENTPVMMVPTPVVTPPPTTSTTTTLVTPSQDTPSEPENAMNQENLSEELDYILSEFVGHMEKSVGSIESQHDLIATLEQSKSSIEQSHAETLQVLHNVEAKQTALAEAEDYEGAEALTSQIEEHQSNISSLLTQLVNIKQKLSDLNSSHDTNKLEQEMLITQLENTLETFEIKSHNDKSAESQNTTFTAESRRLGAERERLTAERGHVCRDRKHLEDERAETEGNINTQTKEITEEAAQVKLELTGVEGDIANLEKLLLAKKAEALELTKRLDASNDAVNAVRLKFDRQLQRIAEREIIIRRSELECDSEEEQLSDEENKHEEQVNAFNSYKKETMRIKQRANDERKAAILLKESLAHMTKLRKLCYGEDNVNDDDDDQSSIHELRSSVLEAETKANEAEVNLTNTLKMVESLKEEANACAEMIPQLEAAKKAAASSKNFKEAGAISKEAKATEAKGEECRNEASKLASQLDTLENIKKQCNQTTIEKRQLLFNAEKELDLIKINALKNLALELRYTELRAEQELAKQSQSHENQDVLKLNSLSYGASIMAKSEVKMILKEISILTNRNEIIDDWELPNELPANELPTEIEKQNNNDNNNDDVVVDKDDKNNNENVDVEEDVADNMSHEVGDGDGVEEVCDEDQEELEQALRNLSGSLVIESTSQQEEGVTSQQEGVGEAELNDDKDNEEVEEVEEGPSEEEELQMIAKAKAIEEEEAAAAEAKAKEEAEARFHLEVEKAKELIEQTESLENQIMEAAEAEDFDLADELQQKVNALEEELNTIQTSAVEAARS